MSQIDNVKRIIIEGFQPDHQDTVSKIAQTYNFAMEQITNTINGKIDINNLDREIIELTIQVDSTGKPTTSSKFAATSGMRGSKVIRALNKSNINIYVKGCPFITYFPTSTNGLYDIKNITGLEANTKYQLLIELIP